MNFTYPDKEWGKEPRYFYRKLKAAGIREEICIDIVNNLRRLRTYQTAQRKRGRSKSLDQSDNYFDNFVDGRGF